MPISSAIAYKSPAVDLSCLRELTNGDAELERQLFAEYIRAGEGFIKILAQSLEEAQSESWRKAAHAFKGLSLNLGAESLGNLCKDAQINHTTDAASKARMLKHIEAEFVEVKHFLTKA